MSWLGWKSNWARSLTFRLAALVMVILVGGIGVVASQAVRQMREEMQRGMIDRVEAEVSLMAADIEREVDTRKWALEQVAAAIAPLLATKDTQALQGFLDARPVFNSNFNRGTFVVGVRGTALASTPSLSGRTGVSYAEHDYMVAALQGGETFIGRPVLTEPLGTPALVMATPVRQQGQIVGALAGVTHLDAPSFLSRLQEFAAVGNHQIKLVDSRNGLVLASNNPALVMQAAQVPVSDGAGIKALQTEGHLQSVKKVNAAGWVLIVSTPLDSAYAAAEAMQNRMEIAAAGVALVSVLLTLWALRVLLHPLTQAAWQLARWTGRGLPFTSALADRRDEMGRLTQRFNLAAGQLQAHSHSLEQSGALMEKAGALAHVGGWELDVGTQKLFWSVETCRIHELDDPVAPGIKEAIKFYAPQSRPVILAAVKDAMEKGTPYDLELEMVTAKGKAIWVQTQCQPVAEGGRVTKLRGAFQDITQRKEDAKRIQELAFSDALTGLPNRRLLLDRLDIAIAASLRHGRRCALIVIDLDQFKLLNDSYGHFKGDLLLQAVAKDLTMAVREGDTVARVGADEFMVLLTDLSGEADEAVQQAKTVSEKILLIVRRSYLLGRLHHYSTASMGITMLGSEPEAPEEPMKRADLAMVKARNLGGNTMQFFEQRMQALIERRVELESAMRQGLTDNAFVLYFQPQVVEHGDGLQRIVGAESLIRWKHPVQGMIPPSEFIPMAEESGLILQLGQWVLETACEQLSRWASHPRLAQLSIAVNVSARQFHQGDFVSAVLHALAASGADPTRLKLELTEGLLVSNLEDVVVKMNALKKLGVSFSLDDFGTGYSSLSYLKRLPLDQLKIDQSFVKDILNDSNDAAIARTVIALADSLGLSIIAEGVETQEQRRFLANEGCLAYQGYFFSRPVPINEFEGLVALSEKPAGVLTSIGSFA